MAENEPTPRRKPFPPRPLSPPQIRTTATSPSKSPKPTVRAPQDTNVRAPQDTNGEEKPSKPKSHNISALKTSQTSIAEMETSEDSKTKYKSRVNVMPNASSGYDVLSPANSGPRLPPKPAKKPPSAYVAAGEADKEEAVDTRQTIYKPSAIKQGTSPTPAMPRQYAPKNGVEVSEKNLQKDYVSKKMHSKEDIYTTEPKIEEMKKLPMSSAPDKGFSGFSNLFSKITTAATVSNLNAMNSIELNPSQDVKADNRTPQQIVDERLTNQMLEEFSKYRQNKKWNVPAVQKIWANDLTYSMDSVEVQVGNGQEMTHRQLRLLEKYTKLQRSFADALMDLYQHEHRKVSCLSPGDRLATLNSGSLALLDQIRIMSQAHQQHALSMETEALKNITILYNEYVRRARDLVTIKRHLSDEISASQQALEKNKLKCLRYLTAMEADAEKDEKMDLNKIFAIAAAAAESTFRNTSTDPIERTYAGLIQYEESLHQTRTFVSK